MAGNPTKCVHCGDADDTKCQCPKCPEPTCQKQPAYCTCECPRCKEKPGLCKCGNCTYCGDAISLVCQCVCKKCTKHAVDCNWCGVLDPVIKKRVEAERKLLQAQLKLDLETAVKTLEQQYKITGQAVIKCTTCQGNPLLCACKLTQALQAVNFGKEKPKIPVWTLDGVRKLVKKGDYTTWQEQVKNLLSGHQLLELIEKGPPPTPERSTDTLQQFNDKTLAMNEYITKKLGLWICLLGRWEISTGSLLNQKVTQKRFGNTSKSYAQQ